MSNKLKSRSVSHTTQAMRDFFIARELANRAERLAFYAFNEHALLCGDHIPIDQCPLADTHRLHAQQLVSTHPRKHDKLFARHAAIIILERAKYGR